MKIVVKKKARSSANGVYSLYRTLPPTVFVEFRPGEHVHLPVPDDLLKGLRLAWMRVMPEIVRCFVKHDPQNFRGLGKFSFGILCEPAKSKAHDCDVLKKALKENGA